MCFGVVVVRIASRRCSTVLPSNTHGRHLAAQPRTHSKPPPAESPAARLKRDWFCTGRIRSPRRLCLHQEKIKPVNGLAGESCPVPRELTNPHLLQVDATSPPNIAPRGNASLTVSGAGFGTWDASASPRVGGTASEASAWTSDSGERPDPRSGL